MASIEGQNAIKHRKKVLLSQQELVDCSSSFGTEGCRGGWMYDAYKYVQACGISQLKDYAYKGVTGKCQNTTVTKTDVKLTNYTLLEVSEEALEKAVGEDKIHKFMLKFSNTPSLPIIYLLSTAVICEK